MALLSEPAAERTDALFRAVTNLPWALQMPPSAPLRRWQRLSRIEQVRQRLDTGQDPAGAAQGLGLDQNPGPDTPADEVILRARLAAHEQHPEAARLYLNELLRRPHLPPTLAAEARRELARLT